MMTSTLFSKTFCIRSASHICNASSHYGKFLYFQVMLCFSRDGDILKQLPSQPAFMQVVVKGKQNQSESTMVFPPSGVIPFHGFTMYGECLFLISECKLSINIDLDLGRYILNDKIQDSYLHSSKPSLVCVVLKLLPVNHILVMKINHMTIACNFPRRNAISTYAKYINQVLVLLLFIIQISCKIFSFLRMSCYFQMQWLNGRMG